MTAPPIGLEAVALSIIVPIKNEEASLVELVNEISTTLHPRSFEILFIDDGSSDGSMGVLTQLARHDARVRVFRLRSNFGKAAALATGFREARGSAVVTIDGDLQDDPRDIPFLLEQLIAGYDLVSGWKVHRKDSRRRRYASKLFNAMTRRLTKTGLHDVNCGLKAYTRECAKEIAPLCYGEMHRFLPVLASWKGFAVTEIAVNHRARPNGRSRYGLERYARGFLDLFTTVFIARFARRPMHMLGVIGLALIGPAALSTIWLVARATLFHAKVGGDALMLPTGLAWTIGFQFVLAGLLAEAITRPHHVQSPYSQVLAMPSELQTRNEERPNLIILPEVVESGIGREDN